MYDWLMTDDALDLLCLIWFRTQGPALAVGLRQRETETQTITSVDLARYGASCANDSCIWEICHKPLEQSGVIRHYLRFILYSDILRLSNKDVWSLSNVYTTSYCSYARPTQPGPIR